MENFINIKKSKKLVLIQIAILIISPILIGVIGSNSRVYGRTGLNSFFNFLSMTSVMLFPLLLFVLAFFQFKEKTKAIISKINLVIALIMLTISIFTLLITKSGFFVIWLIILESISMLFFALIYYFDSMELEYIADNRVNDIIGRINTKVISKVNTEENREKAKKIWGNTKYRYSIIGAIAVIVIASFAGGGSGSGGSGSSSSSSSSVPLYVKLQVVDALGVDYSEGGEILSISGKQDGTGGNGAVEFWSVKGKYKPNGFVDEMTFNLANLPVEP